LSTQEMSTTITANYTLWSTPLL